MRKLSPEELERIAAAQRTQWAEMRSRYVDKRSEFEKLADNAGSTLETAMECVADLWSWDIVSGECPLEGVLSEPKLKEFKRLARKAKRNMASALRGVYDALQLVEAERKLNRENEGEGKNTPPFQIMPEQFPL